VASAEFSTLYISYLSGAFFTLVWAHEDAHIGMYNKLLLNEKIVLHLQEIWTYDVWVQLGSVCKCIILMATIKQVKLECPKTNW
jgi:hypothetical protein